MTSSFKTSKYSGFVPIPDITGLDVPYEQASEMEEVSWNRYVFYQKFMNTHTQKTPKETSVVPIYYSRDTQNLETVYVYREFQC